MSQFYRALDELNALIYGPNRLTPREVREEVHNSAYGAGVFRLNARSVRFRVAKITPNKLGQFAAIWEKDGHGNNAPFSQDTAADLLVIHTYDDERHYCGQFVFPKDVLAAQNVIRTVASDGKMALRVYPEWDKPVSKQAVSTQRWQLPYFVRLHDRDERQMQRLLELYSD
ncbi:MepB family protein [Cohnella sp. 56]|uniref:MepB family protein n=1 Tax=Cohnella sp. 56 TaxID=3113722 RepID=UPI0030E9D034